MAIRLLFFICMCSTSSLIVFAEINDNRNDTPDLNQVMKKFNELQKIISLQNERISALEKGQGGGGPNLQAVIDLQNTVQMQKVRIAELEARVYKLETLEAVEENEPNTSLAPGPEHNETNTNLKDNLVRRGRLLIHPTTLPIEIIAFNAYMSATVSASTPHHILVFDTVVTDLGNAFHSHMGTFIAPRSGLYVFTWTIRLNGNNYHTTELLADNNIVNAIYLNPGNTIDGTVTGTVVVHVNQGDDVFVRTGSLSNGNILSDGNGRSSFAGWNIM